MGSGGAITALLCPRDSRGLAVTEIDSYRFGTLFRKNEGRKRSGACQIQEGTAFFAALGELTELARFFTNSRGENVAERAKIGSGDCSLRRGQGSHRIGTLFCKNEGRKRSGACQNREGDSPLRRGQGTHRIGTLFYKFEGRKHSMACQNRERGLFSSLRSGNAQNWHAFFQIRGAKT